MTIWELRFLDGRGATFYTADPLKEGLGHENRLVTVEVAADVSANTALADAEQCLRSGRTVELMANVNTIAYVIRHETR